MAQLTIPSLSLLSSASPSLRIPCCQHFKHAQVSLDLEISVLYSPHHFVVTFLHFIVPANFLKALLHVLILPPTCLAHHTMKTSFPKFTKLVTILQLFLCTLWSISMWLLGSMWHCWLLLSFMKSSSTWLLWHWSLVFFLPPFWLVLFSLILSPSSSDHGVFQVFICIGFLRLP